jgi:hypothetical protein
MRSGRASRRDSPRFDRLLGSPLPFARTSAIPSRCRRRTRPDADQVWCRGPLRFLIDSGAARRGRFAAHRRHRLQRRRFERTRVWTSRRRHHDLGLRCDSSTDGHQNHLTSTFPLLWFAFVFLCYPLRTSFCRLSTGLAPSGILLAALWPGAGGGWGSWADALAGRETWMGRRVGGALEARRQHVVHRPDGHDSCRGAWSRVAGIASDRDVQRSDTSENRRGPAGDLGVGGVPPGGSPQAASRGRRQDDAQCQRPGGDGSTVRPACGRSGALCPPGAKHHGSPSRRSNGLRITAAGECDHRLRRCPGGPVTGQDGAWSRLPSRNAQA